RERIRAPALDAAVQPRAMAEHVQAARTETDGHARRPGGTRERTQRAREKSEQRGVGIALRRQPVHALDDPGPLAEALEVRADRREGIEDVEVVDAHEVGAARVEEDELAQREQLQRAAEARAHPPG